MKAGDTPTPDQERYPWTRRPNETEQAYATFKAFLDLGPGRSLVKLADKLGKNVRGLEAMSSRHDWSARVAAYTAHVDSAQFDGLKDALAISRDKNLVLIDRLREHLANRLEVFIQRGSDPTAQWTSALRAMAALEGSTFAYRDDTKTDEKIDHVLELVRKVIKED